MMMVLQYDKISAESAVSHNHFRPRHAISNSWTVACEMNRTGGTSFCKYPHFYLVGGIPTPLKKMKVSWDDDIPYIYIYMEK